MVIITICSNDWIDWSIAYLPCSVCGSLRPADDYLRMPWPTTQYYHGVTMYKNKQRGIKKLKVLGDAWQSLNDVAMQPVPGNDELMPVGL